MSFKTSIQIYKNTDADRYDVPAPKREPMQMLWIIIAAAAGASIIAVAVVIIIKKIKA